MNKILHNVSKCSNECFMQCTFLNKKLPRVYAVFCETIFGPWHLPNVLANFESKYAKKESNVKAIKNN